MSRTKLKVSEMVSLTSALMVMAHGYDLNITADELKAFRKDVKIFNNRKNRRYNSDYFSSKLYSTVRYLRRFDIDMFTASEGDFVVSCHGDIYQYSHHAPDTSYPHILTVYNEYGGYVTRNDDGSVYSNKRLATDHDIVKIFKYGDVMDMLNTLNRLMDKK